MIITFCLLSSIHTQLQIWKLFHLHPHLILLITLLLIITQLVINLRLTPHLFAQCWWYFLILSQVVYKALRLITFLLRLHLRGFLVPYFIKLVTYSAFHSKFCKVMPGLDNILSTKYPIFSTLLTAMVI